MAKVSASDELDGVALSTVELLEAEASPMGFMYMSGVNTLSFFSGELDEAVSYYTGRLKLVLQSNPWLAGTLLTRKEGKVDKVYMQHRKLLATDEEALEDLFGTSSKICNAPILVVDRADSIVVSPKNSYMQNFNAINAGKCIIPDGYTSISTKNPLSKFTLTKCEGGFALIASISHVVCDGHTYYKIMGMLTEKGQVEALNTVRRHDFKAEDTRLIGSKQRDFIFGMNMYNMGFLYQMIGNACCCSKKMHVSYYVDANKVEVLKSKVREEGEVKFCSTHDLITSHFCNVTQPRLLQYVVNQRRRLPLLLTDQDAGNYETCLLFGPDIYGKPANVRKVIAGDRNPDTPFSHGGSEGKKPLPKGCEALRAKTSVLTSWCFDSYSGDLSFGNCKMDLHIPMMETGGMPMNLLIIYKATATRLGCMYVVDPSKVSKLQANEDSILSQEECFPGC